MLSKLITLDRDHEQRGEHVFNLAMRGQVVINSWIAGINFLYEVSCQRPFTPECTFGLFYFWYFMGSPVGEVVISHTVTDPRRM